MIVDPSAASFIALLRQSDIFKPKEADNSVLDGIRRTSTCINNGLIKVHSRCKNWKRESQSYVWDEKSGEDKPKKEFDHLMDARRYFVNTKRIYKGSSSYSSILG